MNNNNKVVEFKGCDNLVIAEVLYDDRENGYKTGAVTQLAPIGKLTKKTDSNIDSKHYDNTAMLTIRSEGVDEFGFQVPALDLQTLARLTGKQFDVNTGAFIDGESKEVYFAIGYRIKLTDGSHRYAWRLKSTFSIPDEEVETEKDGADSTNQELSVKGLKTITEFANGGRTKGVVVDERDGKSDVTNWFDTVQTPDTIIKLGNLGTLSVILQAGSDVGKTQIISISPNKTANTKFVYKLAAAATNVTNGMDCSAWIPVAFDVDITATTGQVITVAEVTKADSKAIRAGSNTVVLA